MKIRLTIFATVLIALLSVSAAIAKDGPKPGKAKQFTVAFYNLENLFDTEDDPAISDEEYLPKGTYEWTEERYKKKLAQMARVIAQLGDDDGPEVLGVCEAENRKVLEDLAIQKALKSRGYAVAHANSPDQRGIDVALIYKSKRFVPLYQRSYRVPFPENKDLATRDIFLVKGLLDKDIDLTLVVNHWPSRRDGQDESAWKRERAAQTLRTVVDSILKLDPYSNLVMMGDFNDEPGDPSMYQTLKAGRDSIESRSTLLYNCMALLKLGGRGTLKFKGGWNLFDQIIVTGMMLTDKTIVRYVKGSANIYNPEWMRETKEGDWKDAPLRTYIGKKYVGDGFSDHFPVHVTLEYR